MTTTETTARVRRADWPTAAALGLVAGVYVWLAFFFLPPGVYWSPDIGYKRLQAENVRFTPWLDLTIDYPGAWLDPEFKYVPFRYTFYYLWQGRLHFAQPPAMAVLGSPFVALFGDRGESVVPVLAGLVCVGLTARLMRAVGARPPWAGVLLAGLATPMLIYGLFLWEHILGVALGLGAMTLAFEGTDASTPRRLLFSGLLTGLAASVRKELMLLALVLGAVLTLNILATENPRRRQAWKGLALWAGAGALVLAAYELISFLNSGYLVPPEFRISLAPEYTPRAYLLTHGLRSLADFIFDPQFGLMGDLLIVAVAAYGLASRGPRTRVRDAIQVAALAALGIGVWNGVRQLGAAGGLIGLLSASPFLVVGSVAEARDRAARNLLWLTLGFYALALLNLSLFTAAGPYQAGLEWGTRFALIVFPLSVPFVLDGLRTIRARTAHSWLARLHLALALLLIGLSVFIQLRGVSKMSTPAVGPQSRAEMLAAPERQVLTNLWWLTAAAPQVYQAKEVFFVNSEAELRAWLGAAYPRGVRGFAFVGYVPLDPPTAASTAPPGIRLTVVETRGLSNQMILTRVEMGAAP